MSFITAVLTGFIGGGLTGGQEAEPPAPPPPDGILCLIQNISAQPVRILLRAGQATVLIQPGRSYRSYDMDLGQLANLQRLGIIHLVDIRD